MGFDYSPDSSENQPVSETGGAKSGANGEVRKVPSETDLATALTLIATLPLSNEEKAAAIRLLLLERKGI